MPIIEYLPPNTRVYAIGDIHGGLSLLENLIDVITANELISAPKENLHLIFLGDYIDRGMHSKKVIDTLQAKLPSQFQTVFLKGNHEELMLDALDFESRQVYANFQRWFYAGGQNTIRSYGVAISNNFDEMAEHFYHVLKQTHLKFFQNLPVKFEIGHYFFCHAGIRPNIPLQEQSAKEMLWIRDLFLDSTLKHEKIIVHGHTPEIVKHHGNRIGVDAGSVMSGKLAAVCLEEDGSHQFLIVKGRQEWTS